MRFRSRIATIVIADIVGYSLLIEDDPYETLLCFSRIRSKLVNIRAHERASMVRYAGDSVLLAFPSARDALSCTLEIQRSIGDFQPPGWEGKGKSILFRIGIHVGRVFDVEGDLHGTAVNVAARLQALAMPGEICLSRDVLEEIQPAPTIPFEELGERRLKNIRDAVRTLRIGGGDIQAWVPERTCRRSLVGLG